MANTYYPISPSTNTLLAIKTALEGKYGAGVTVHYQSATDIVFACTALSDKVIKINYSSTYVIMIYYGDAWSSGTTITNQVLWGGYNTGSSTFIDMILGDYIMMICSYQGTAILGTLFILGKLSNDKYACLSACGSNSSTFYQSYISRNTTDAINLYPVCFSDAFASGSGKLFKQPLILQRSDGKVEINTDGSIASFRDIYNCSHALANNVVLVGSNYLMSSGNLFTGASGKRLITSMIAEFTP